MPKKPKVKPVNKIVLKGVKVEEISDEVYAAAVGVADAMNSVAQAEAALSRAMIWWETQYHACEKHTDDLQLKALHKVRENLQNYSIEKLTIRRP